MPYIWTYKDKQKIRLPCNADDCDEVVPVTTATLARGYGLMNTYARTQGVWVDYVRNRFLDATQYIKVRLQYLEKSDSDQLLGLITDYTNNIPEYMTQIRSVIKSVYISEYQYYRHCRRRWSGRYRGSNHYHGETVRFHDGWTFKLNKNFKAQINKYKAIILAIRYDVNKNIIDNCDNPHTLLTVSGLTTCGIYEKLAKFRNDIKLVKDRSNRVMSLIKNTTGFPQYSQAKQMDDTINYWYNWDPMDQRSTYNNGCAELTQIKILTLIGENPDGGDGIKGSILRMYDFCVSNLTHIGLDNDNLPVCPSINNDYMKSAQRCGQAIQMSKVYEYGTDKLTDLWTDVSNNIPGQGFTQASLILNTGNDSCKKWVDMFNVWEKLEDEALATPCNPERPISSVNDKTLIEMADNWNKSASDHIKQLKLRLLKIQKYIKNYPNVLHVDKDGITIAPFSMTPTAIIKKNYTQSKDGESPIQHLEMIIPNGVPGKQGKEGITGLPGPLGKRGIIGSGGKTGNNNIPEFYNIIK